MSFRSTLRYGLPFLSFMVLGSFLLREFASIRYEVYSYKRRYGASLKDRNLYEEDDDEPANTSINEDAEIQKLKEMGANDDWQNIRGPRPWEDNSQFNNLMESLRQKSKK
ncbi:Cytochrome oxidase assembly [Blomia tropicalis]|nr:Cytochrome oxidase assembly [Blomia tropicalis]